MVCSNTVHILYNFQAIARYLSKTETFAYSLVLGTNDEVDSTKYLLSIYSLCTYLVPFLEVFDFLPHRISIVARTGRTEQASSEEGL